jgi:hypothetical protein
MIDCDVKATKLAELRGLVSSITASLDEYEYAKDALDAQHVLTTIASQAQSLKTATVSVTEAFSDFTLQPLANACVRIALSIGIFDHLPGPECPGKSLEGLADATNAELDLVLRVVRGLVAFDVIHVDDANGLYSHTPMSIIYADPTRRAWAIWMWDVMISAATRGIGPHFDEHSTPIANPKDGRNAPFTLAHGEHDKDVFEIVKSIGKLPLLQNAMSGSSVVCAKEAVASFDFASLAPRDDGMALVDVGGAKGQTIREIQHAYPGLRGTFVLQDLQSVLDQGSLPGLDAQTMAYDFFKDTQPVKGATAYFYQRIFHDWSDEASARILQSLKPAMAKHSKLLICDIVVPDVRPPTRKVLRDMNMLLVGGMERSERQWTALLEREGFVIDAFHGLMNADNSIIEASLA